MVYIDHVLTAPETLAAHKSVLREIFRICHQHRVQLSIGKCHFMTHRFVFLSHEFANGTRAPDPAQEAAITQLLDPETTTLLALLTECVLIPQRLHPKACRADDAPAAAPN